MSTSPPEGGIAYYRLEGNAVDEWNGHDGTLTGTTPATDGTREILRFSGGASGVDLPQHALNQGFTQISIAARVYVPDTAPTQMIYEEGGGGGGANLYIDGGSLHGGVWEESAGFSGEWTSAPITPDEWHHVAYTYDQIDGGRLYIDGSQVDVYPGTSGDGKGSVYSHTGNNRIGYSGDTKLHSGDFGTGAGFDGYIANVRLYDRVLSATEVETVATGETFGEPESILIQMSGGVTTSHTDLPDVPEEPLSGYSFEGATTDKVRFHGPYSSTDAPVANLPDTVYYGNPGAAEAVYTQLQDSDVIESNVEGGKTSWPLNGFQRLEADLSDFSSSEISLDISFGIRVGDADLFGDFNIWGVREGCTVETNIKSIQAFPNLGLQIVTFGLVVSCEESPGSVGIVVQPKTPAAGQTDEQDDADGTNEAFKEQAEVWLPSRLSESDDDDSGGGGYGSGGWSFSGSSLLAIYCSGCLGPTDSHRVTVGGWATRRPDSFDVTIEYDPAQITPDPDSVTVPRTSGTPTVEVDDTAGTIRVAHDAPYWGTASASRMDYWHWDVKSREDTFPRYPAFFSFDVTSAAGGATGEEVTLLPDYDTSTLVWNGYDQPTNTHRAETLTLAGGANISPGGPIPYGERGTSTLRFTGSTENVASYHAVLEHNGRWLRPQSVTSTGFTIQNWHTESGRTTEAGRELDLLHIEADGGPGAPAAEIEWDVRYPTTEDAQAGEIESSSPLALLTDLTSVTSTGGESIVLDCTTDTSVEFAGAFQPRSDRSGGYFVDDVHEWPIIIPLTLVAPGMRTDLIDPECVRASIGSPTNPRAYSVKEYVRNGTEFDPSLLVWHGYAVIPKADPQALPVKFAANLVIDCGGPGGGGLWVGQGVQMGPFGGVAATSSFSIVNPFGRGQGRGRR